MKSNKILKGFACVCSFLFIGLSMLGYFLPRPAEALSISDVVEIVTPPRTFYALDVNSSGYVFAYAGNGTGWSIYGSADSGRTWTQLSTGTGSGNTRTMWVDSNDYLWAQVNAKLQKFDENGQNPSAKLTMSSWLWHFTQAPNGSMYANKYAPNSGLIYGSHDSGETWSVVFNATEKGSSWWHPHSVRADPYTGDLYVCSGDEGNQVEIWKYTESTKTWGRLSQGRSNAAYRGVDLWETDFTFDSNYVYMGSDTGRDKITRFQKGDSPWTAETLVSSKYWTNVNFVRKLERIDGVFVFCTRNGIIGASWDGEHWVILYDAEDNSGNSYSITTRRAKDNSILVDDAGNGKVVKLHIDADVLRHLFYNGFVSETDDTITVSQIIRNGTSYVDLSGYILNDTTLKMTGVSHENLLKNSTFEGTGTAEQQGWRLSDTRYGTVEINSTESYHGSKSLKFVVTASWVGVTTTKFRTGTYTTIYHNLRNQVAVMHFYAKANASHSDGIGVRIDYKNSTDSDYLSKSFSMNATWQAYHWACVVPNWATQYSIHIRQKYAGVEVFLDEAQLEFYESTTFESKGRQYAKFDNFTFDANMLNTTNPTMTIAGSQYCYSGVLANNTVSQTWTLGEIGGIIPVSALVQGSGQVKITVTGTKQLSTTNVVIRSWGSPSNVGYGLYVGGFTVTTSQNYLLVLANMTTSNITSASYSASELTFTVYASSVFLSTTKVYCGSNGEPTNVTGATSWSYNSETKIVTINVLHTSSKEVIVYFAGLPVPEFPLGASMEIGLISIIIFIWWKNRRKISRNTCR